MAPNSLESAPRPGRIRRARNPLRRLFAASLVILWAAAVPETTAATEDSLYSALHPRLMFTGVEIPLLYEKVRDGGPDDDAYDFIRFLTAIIYPGESGLEYDTNVMPNIGLATYLESPADTTARELGRRLTLFIADSLEADDNTFYSPLRLRSLALGYDMFFEESPAPERARVRHEIESYIDTILTAFNYQRWLHPPYVSNLSAMIGGALGMGAICLAGETDPQRVETALAVADTFIVTWLRYQVDPDGAYKEGALYAAWSMRNLAYYFWARKRYDGYDFSETAAIRNMEKWLAFELLPEGEARVNNINDTGYLDLPLSHHNTYFEWAQTAWQSRISAWLWEHLVGPEYGHDSGRLADKAATVLWHQRIPPVPPADVLPTRFLWRDRGLYYFRTGWQAGASSEDVVFSFYSGKFYGGHCQEDQNHFTLYGRGGKFALDNGPGQPARQSEAHNIVFIDGQGQHHSGGSVGTDGRIGEYLLGGFADYLLGDATSAYTTYSEFNLPGQPFPDDDWSWGYDGGNPVNYAFRRIVAVHDAATPPYFIIVDEIDKDGLVHTYEWRLHTSDQNVVHTAANPLTVESGQGRMSLCVVHPPYEMLSATLTPFNNFNGDPNTTVLSLSYDDTTAYFAVFLLPLGAEETPPAHTIEETPWGSVFTVDWGAGLTDMLVLNLTGDVVAHPTTEAPGGPDRATTAPIFTDADITLIRRRGGGIERYLVVNAARVDIDGVPYVEVTDGDVTADFSGGFIRIDRASADFRFYAPGATEVRCENRSIPTVRDGDYLIPDDSRPRVPYRMKVVARPNPFNSTTTVVVHIDEGARVAVDVYDAAGRFVKHLWDGYLPPGGAPVTWNGTDGRGHPVASGVYFVRVRANGRTQSGKLLLLK